MLRRHDFKGNVRELRGMVFDAVGACRDGLISPNFFADSVDGFRSIAEVSEAVHTPLPTLRTANDTLLNEALRRANGNQAEAARTLGVSRQALNKRLSRRKRKKAS